MITCRRLIRSLVGGCSLIGGDCLIRCLVVGCRLIGWYCLINCLVVRICRVARDVARLRTISSICCLVGGRACVCEVVCLISCLVCRNIARLGTIHWCTSIACMVRLSCILGLIGGLTHVLCLI